MSGTKKSDVSEQAKPARKAAGRAPGLQDQGRQWNRHAARYDELFLDAFHPGVENPLLAALDAVPEPARGRWPTSAAGPARSCSGWPGGSAG